MPFNDPRRMDPKIQAAIAEAANWFAVKNPAAVAKPRIMRIQDNPASGFPPRKPLPVRFTEQDVLDSLVRLETMDRSGAIRTDSQGATHYEYTAVQISHDALTTAAADMRRVHDYVEKHLGGKGKVHKHAAEELARIHALAAKLEGLAAERGSFCNLGTGDREALSRLCDYAQDAYRIEHANDHLPPADYDKAVLSKVPPTPSRKGTVR